jgi:hypothetical protein
LEAKEILRSVREESEAEATHVKLWMWAEPSRTTDGLVKLVVTWANWVPVEGSMDNQC